MIIICVQDACLGFATIIFILKGLPGLVSFKQISLFQIVDKIQIFKLLMGLSDKMVLHFSAFISNKKYTDCHRVKNYQL